MTAPRGPNDSEEPGPARQRLTGQVALVTGAAQGLGEGIARHLAGQGVRVVVADVDERRGAQVAGAIGGRFVRCDVADLHADEVAVAAAVDTFGGLDIAVLNAGVAGDVEFGEGFDAARVHTVVAVNLVGVVYGIQAALPALRAGAGGHLVVTASLAGLVAVPVDPVYAATKHAVVGLVRSLGPVLAADGIRVNALCPSFARTAIVAAHLAMLQAQGIPLLDVDDIVDAFAALLASTGTGQCWTVVPGRASEPFRFRGVPGVRGGPAATAT